VDTQGVGAAGGSGDRARAAKRNQKVSRLLKELSDTSNDERAKLKRKLAFEGWLVCIVNYCCDRALHV
jgi:hypothetical protein